jgi:hypothetical protein
MFETALRADAKRRIRQIGRADIVVGIPSYRNAKTIAGVVEAVVTGLSSFYTDQRAVIMNADGGSSDNTAQIAAEVPSPVTIRRITTGYHGMAGKGSAVRAILQVAHALEADVCIILEAGLKDISPEWVRSLAAPILSGQYDFVAPYYTYPHSEAGPHDLLIYPLFRMLLGKDLRQPAGGELALSGALAGYLADKDVWETDVARAGIDVWMSTMAAYEGRKVCQVALGTKRHEGREPSSTTDQAFSQMLGTLFRMAYILRKVWLSFPTVDPVPVVGKTPLEPAEPGVMTETYLADKFRLATKRQRRMWQVVLIPELLEEVKEIVKQPPESLQFPDDIWAKVVYNKGEADPDRVVDALFPLCCARHLALLKETEGMSVTDTEAVIRRQAEAFVAARPYLLDRWNSYIPWAPVPGLPAF